MTELRVDIEFRLHDGFGIDAEFAAAGGEITNLVGPSGSGKSTLLSLIAGLLQPDEGKIEVGECTLFCSDSSKSVRPWDRRVGLLFQQDALFPHMSVRKNLSFGATTRSHSPWQFDSLVQLFEIGELLDRKPGQLSGGQRDRVAMGRTLLSQPEILLLDEPLNSVQRSLRESILDFVRNGVAELGIPALLVSHDSNLLSCSGGKVFTIEDGKLSAMPDQTQCPTEQH